MIFEIGVRLDPKILASITMLLFKVHLYNTRFGYRLKTTEFLLLSAKNSIGEDIYIYIYIIYK
jgi:hypothetical protein